MKPIKDFIMDVDKVFYQQYARSNGTAIDIDDVEELMIKYAIEVVKADREQIAKNAKVQTFLKENKRWKKVKGNFEFDPTSFEMKNEVDKNSILNFPLPELK